LPVALLALLASCKKEDATTVATTANAPAKKMTASGGGTAVVMSGYDGTHIVDFECDGPKKDCIELPPIVIRPTQLQLYAIGQAAINGPVAVGQLFSGKDMQPVIDYLYPELGDKLKSGEYGLILNYDGDAVVNYCVGKGKASMDNFEFVLQFTK